MYLNNSRVKNKIRVYLELYNKKYTIYHVGHMVGGVKIELF